MPGSSEFKRFQDMRGMNGMQFNSGERSQGDQEAQQICEEISDYFALGIGIISNLLNPSKILIGGGVSLTGDYLFDLIQEKR